MTRTRWLLLIAGTFMLPGCGWDGHFNILGYTTNPPYDCDIRTVYVPMFQNITLRRGLEIDLTRAVVREIEAKSPYKVVSRRENADTELDGKIVARRKAVINVNQLNEVREAEAGLAVEVVWRDLRPGRVGDILSQPRKRDFDPLAPPDAQPKVQPVVLMPVGTFIPELGGSITSAERQAVDRLAIQIVSMMERFPW